MVRAEVPDFIKRDKEGWLLDVGRGEVISLRRLERTE